MRHLHPVGISEKFVASGKYVEYKDDTPGTTIETWSIHALPDGAQLIRVDIDYRRSNGRGFLIEAWVNPPQEGQAIITGAAIAGAISRLDVSAFGGPQDAFKHGRATYLFDAGRVEIGRTLDKHERIYEELPLPPHTVIAGGSTLMYGFASVRMAALFPVPDGPLVLEDYPGVSGFSFSPDMNADTALQGSISKEVVRRMDQETITLGKRTYNATHYAPEFPAYSLALPHFWADEHDVTLRQDGYDDTYLLLTDYARRG